MTTQEPTTSSAMSTRGFDKKALKPLVRKPVLSELDLTSLALGIQTHTCPQCASAPASERVEHRFTSHPSWLFFFVISPLIFLLVYFITRTTVRSSLNLCGECKNSMTRATLIRSLSVVGAIAAPIALAFLGAALHRQGGLILGGVGLVAGVVGSFIAHKRTINDVLLVKSLKKENVWIEGKQHRTTTLEVRSCAQFREVLEKEAPHLLEPRPTAVG